MMRDASCSPGFTLLEIVMTFVLFGIVAAVAVSFFTTGVTRTDIPVRQLQTNASLQLVLENMIADKEKEYDSDLSGFSNKLGDTGQSLSTYGGGATYILTDKRFVCPDGNSFLNSTTANQFLLITVKTNASSSVNVTYLFKSTGTTNNCTNNSGN